VTRCCVSEKFRCASVNKSNFLIFFGSKSKSCDVIILLGFSHDVINCNEDGVELVTQVDKVLFEFGESLNISIDAVEDREKFNVMLNELKVR